MDIGGFSLSLSVSDIGRSKEFYQNLGFRVFHGDESQGWLIMKGPRCNIGLFQGMFEGNIMTFNPGWDENAQPVDGFKDVREIQQHLKDAGIPIVKEIDAPESGPASFVVQDPDGNQILFDQHV